MSEDFSALAAEFWKQCDKGLEPALATVDGEGVASRAVAVVPVDGKLCFSTMADSNKMKQIALNPRVALCLEAIQVRGTARAAGALDSPEGKPTRDALVAAFGERVEPFINDPGMIVVEITPTWGGFGRLDANEMFEPDFVGRRAHQVRSLIPI